MTVREMLIRYGFAVDRNSEKKAENQIKGMKNLATKLLGKVAVVFSVAKVTQFTKECLAMASNVQEMQNKFDVVFKGMTDDVEEWADTFAKSIGRNKNSVKQYLADNQNLFVGMGMARDRAAELSKELVSGALDIASFNNIQEADAVRAMSKALMGETESAKTLGAVLNDNTRAMAMEAMGLKGKFTALDEATKMEVNYKAIMLQSKDAMGDCVRSMSSYEARQRQLTAAVQYFKEFVGTSLLPVFSVFLNMITKGINFLTALAQKIIGVTEEENRILKLFERIQAIVKKLQPAIDRMMQTLSNGARRGVDFIKGIVEKLGGTENALKLLALTMGALYVVLNASKILAFFNTFKTLATGIFKVFNMGTLKIMAMVAVIVILALIVEDFVHFLMGNDSVIGSIFDKAGIGADNARNAIKKAWTSVVSFLKKTWDTLKSMVDVLKEVFGKFIDDHAGMVKSDLLKGWQVAKDILVGVWNALGQILSSVFGKQTKESSESSKKSEGAVVGTWRSILTAITSLLSALMTLFSSVFNAIMDVIKSVLDDVKVFWDVWGTDITAMVGKFFETCKVIFDSLLLVIKGLADFITGVFTGNWSQAWDGIVQILKGIWDTIVALLEYSLQCIWLGVKMILTALLSFWLSIWNKIKEFVVNVWTTIKEFVVNAITNLVNGIKEKASMIKNAIVDGFKAGIDYIKSLPEQALKWGSDMIDGIVNGIKGAKKKVTNAVKGVASDIKSFLHFSVPDEGPLTDYESWMPDFMQGLAKGIYDNKNVVLDSVRVLADGMAMLTKAAVSTPTTAANSTVNNRTSNMTQNVNISNSYSGGSKETQKNISKAMNKSAEDATTYMARGLAYSRG